MNAGYYVLCAFGGYVVTSVSLLIWPCLHRKKDAREVCRAHISHRGGAGEGPENTMIAYDRAIKCRTEMLELDVHLSADKKIVVSHDNNLKRTTGEDIHIRDTHSENLPILSRSLPVTFYNSTYLHDGDDVQLAFLEDVFQKFPEVPINLDLKEYDEELIEEANKLIKAYNREHKIVWGNFSDKTCQKLYKVNPEVPLLFSMKRVLVMYILFYFGLLPFVPLKETALEILMPSAVKHSRMAGSLTRFQRVMVTILDFLMMSRVLFYHLKKRGILVYLWVLNEDEDFKRAFKLGANGVMTDYPSRLTKWLDEHPQYKTQQNDI